MRFTRAALLRVLLAITLAAAIAVPDALAQTCERNCPPPPIPTPEHSGNRAVWYVIGGVAAGIIALMVKNQIERTTHEPSAQPPTPPRQPPPTLTQMPLSGGGGASGGSSQPSGGVVQPLRAGFSLPAAGAAFVPDEIILDIPATVSTETLDAIAARHRMTRASSFRLFLTGRTIHRWRLDGGGSPIDMLRNISSGERQVAGGQVNFLYALAQGQAAPAEVPAANPDQYVPAKLHLSEAHRLARGSGVVIAVLDSGVDVSHPELAGAVAGQFDATGENERPHPHGTGMAGAIAAHRTMLGVAPAASLLAVRAFGIRENSVEGTTFNILRGLDWAAERGARIVNMSFAGPADPRLRGALAAANRRGMVLIAAAGNAGPQSPPLFPAADPSVIAVTATDARDAIFPGANRGNHIAVAAPGVDVLVPALDGTYQFTTGTSVAAAEVSGAAALLMERSPALKGADVRRILMDTARRLGGRSLRDRDFGAGLVDALRALGAARAAPVMH